MSPLLEKKPLVSAPIIVSLVFIAFALFVAGSIDFSRQQEGKKSGISWSSPAGSGISIPACASAGIPPVTTACNGNIAEATISWTDPLGHGEGVNLDVCKESWCPLIVYTPAGMFNPSGWDAFTLPAAGSVTLTPLENNTTYLYALRSVTEAGGVTVVAAYPTFTTLDCAVSGGGSAPVAEAGISKDGSLFRTSVNVFRGALTQIWFSADQDTTGDGLASRDPDGWANPVGGVSRGGRCEWNVDLRPGFSVQRTIENPPTAAACNTGPLSKVFNDPPGLYEYEVFRIIDQAGNASNIASVFVNVVSSVSARLVANPPIINPGQTSALTWDTEGFGSGDCSIDQGIGPVAADGEQIVSPITTTRYTLFCDNGTDRAQTQTVVTVSGLPTIREIPPR